MQSGIPVPRGGLIRWAGPSAHGRYTPARVDGTQLIQIERIIGDTLAGLFKGHPCIGARKLVAPPGFYYAVYRDMHTVESAVQLLNDVSLYYQESDVGDKIIKSFICVFTIQILSTRDFAATFWRFIQLLHDLD
jgi:FPC/CPF motif-containing protein YcgG